MTLNAERKISCLEMTGKGLILLADGCFLCICVPSERNKHSLDYCQTIPLCTQTFLPRPDWQTVPSKIARGKCGELRYPQPRHTELKWRGRCEAEQKEKQRCCWFSVGTLREEKVGVMRGAVTEECRLIVRKASVGVVLAQMNSFICHNNTSLP